MQSLKKKKRNKREIGINNTNEEEVRSAYKKSNSAY